jgi:glutamate synthase domain-containing protein 3
MAYLGRQLSAGNYLKLDDISSQFNGTTRTFDLRSGGNLFYPGSAFSILVVLGGVIQEPESAYTIDQYQITFASAPGVSDDFFCIALGVALGIGVPGEGTVTGSKLSSIVNYDSGTLYLDSINHRVGMGTINPQFPAHISGTGSTSLYVEGNARITGILTVGTGSITIDGVNNTITGVTQSNVSNTNVTGIATFTNGPVLIGSGTSTGTASQPLQVTGGAYVSGNLGIGTTNPTTTLQVQGTVSVSSTTTSSEFVGGGSDLRNLSGTHLVSYASASDISNSALSIAGISTYSQVGILTGSLAVDGGFGADRFGTSVAVSADGKTIIVGANQDEIGATTSTGVVYVFDRVGSSFNQVGILTGSLAVDANDFFGISVATSADGKTIVVGAAFDEIGATTTTGVVYVFDRVGNSFNQVGILTGSLAVDATDVFGISVATSADGKTIIVGATADEIGATTGTGVVYVFDRVGSSFNQVGILTGSLAVDASDAFGRSVATSADGKTIIVGTINDEIGATLSTGVVYVYDRVGNSFNQVGILTGSLAVDANDNFGISVATSADGKTIIVGANNDEIGANNASGVVYVFDRVGSSFNQVGILTGSLAVDASDFFGWSVATSADGKTIVVGAYGDEIGATTSTGVAYIFKRQGNSFNQVGILTGSLAVDASDFFGTSVAVSADGKTIIVGATQDEIGATTSTGVVYVFDETRDTYVYSGPTGNIGIGTASPAVSLDLKSKTDAIALPQGTTAQRPTGNNPYIRYNTTNSALEFYNGTDWVEIISDYFPSGSTILG